MFIRFYAQKIFVQKVICSKDICSSEGPMFRRFKFQKVLYSEGPIFGRSYVQKTIVHNVLYIQKVLCPEGPIFRYVQKVLYSEDPLFYRGKIRGPGRPFNTRGEGMVFFVKKKLFTKMAQKIVCFINNLFIYV